MALDLASLKTALENAFGVNQVSDTTSKANIQAMADTIATAIDTYVKTGLVTVTIPVTSAPGTPSSGTGTIS